MWVSNHTSMIDYIILTAYSPFAVIMQLHPGWVCTSLNPEITLTLTLTHASKLTAARLCCHVTVPLLALPSIAATCKADE